MKLFGKKRSKKEWTKANANRSMQEERKLNEQEDQFMADVKLFPALRDIDEFLADEKGLTKAEKEKILKLTKRRNV